MDLNLDQALEIANDASLNAYCDFVHHTVYTAYGEFEFDFDPEYDRIAYAFAFVAVELAMDEGALEYVPPCGDAAGHIEDHPSHN